jgi:hypothetical protein
MFERFFEGYQVTATGDEADASPLPNPWSGGPIRGWDEFFTQCPGATFKNGIYRLHTTVSALAANQLFDQTFPHLKGNALCFGFDWLGRQFALDLERMIDGEPGVQLIDFVERNAYEIDVTFRDLHNVVFIEKPDSALEAHVFAEWAPENQQSLPLRRSQIVGYRIPLTLGGQHEIANMVVEDMEVSLELDRQIQDAIRGIS